MVFTVSYTNISSKANKPQASCGFGNYFVRYMVSSKVTTDKKISHFS